MKNPYLAPSARNAALPTSQESTNRSKLRTVLMAFTAFAIVAFCGIAVALLIQAIQLTNGDATAPARFQGQNASMIRISYIGALVAFSGVIANAFAILFLRRRLIGVPVGIIALSIAAMIAVAILFKP